MLDRREVCNAGYYICLTRKVCDARNFIYLAGEVSDP